MARRLVDLLKQWSSEDQILEPYTHYRLHVATKVDVRGALAAPPELNAWAYFHTQGPPGLVDLPAPEPPEPSPKATIVKHGKDGAGDHVHAGALRGQGNGTMRSDFKSQLASLEPYIRQTVPPTKPASGQPPLMPRPVYRAYDVGVEFNENYVGSMYRLSKRDLGLYLFDQSNRPVRDAAGRIFRVAGNWVDADVTTLSESEKRWADVVKGSPCRIADYMNARPKHNALVFAADGKTLEPETSYEARLVPLLLHDDFSQYAADTTASGPGAFLGRWLVVDVGAKATPTWMIRDLTVNIPGSSLARPVLNLHAETRRDRIVEQIGSTWDDISMLGKPLPGSVLLWTGDLSLPKAHPDQPASWTNYRISSIIHPSEQNSGGIVFRYKDADNWYCFQLHRGRKVWCLSCTTGGRYQKLAEEAFTYVDSHQYETTLEVLGNSLKCFLDGDLLYEKADMPSASGSVGLYALSAGGRFKDVRCDDLRDVAPVPYRFRFVTSRFTNFAHHLQSFDDETWRVDVPAGSSLEPHLGSAKRVSVRPKEEEKPGEAEFRAYDSLAAEVFRNSARTVERIEVSRIVRGGESLMLHLASPEPLDWARTGCEIFSHDEAPMPHRPSQLKLIDVVQHAREPIGESVTLLARETLNVGGYKLFVRLGSGEFPTLDDSQTDWQPYYELEPFTLFAGRRIRVFSGNAADFKESAEPGVEKQFVAKGSALGSVRFAMERLDLMLVAPHQRVQHVRRFFRESQATSLDLIRRRDGLGCFLVPRVDSVKRTYSLDLKGYKLGWVFQRSAANPRLTENGLVSEERTTIDVPWRETK
jgi:hypothetical protein